MGKPSVCQVFDKWIALVHNILDIITFNVRTEKKTFLETNRLFLSKFSSICQLSPLEVKKITKKFT